MKNKQTNMESICIGHPLLSIRPALECGWYTQDHSTGENWFSLSQQESTANSFLFRGETMYPLPFLHTEDFVWLAFVWVFAHAVNSLWVCMCICSVVTRRFFLGARWWALTIFPPLLLHRSLSFERRGLIRTSHLGLNIPHCLHIAQLWVYCKKQLLWGRLSDAWSMGVEVCQESFYCYVHLAE